MSDRTVQLPGTLGGDDRLMSFEDVAALGCGDCGGDVDDIGQCFDCGAWISGLEPNAVVVRDGR